MKHDDFCRFTLLTIALSSGDVLAETAEREPICLEMGKYAELVVKNRELGRSEEDAKKALNSGRKVNSNINVNTALQKVLAWVYTVNPSPSEARRLVYLKCLNREFLAQPQS